MAPRILVVVAAALVAVGAASAAPPRDGAFKGTTSQKLKVQLQVLEGAISLFDATVKCGSKSRQATSFPAVRAKPDGSFAFTDAVAKVKVSGKFTTATSVTGKIVPSGPGCKPVTFTAKR